MRASVDEVGRVVRQRAQRIGHPSSQAPLLLHPQRRQGVAVAPPDPPQEGGEAQEEEALMSDDPQIRDAAIHDAGEIVRAAHRAVASK